VRAFSSSTASVLIRETFFNCGQSQKVFWDGKMAMSHEVALEFAPTIWRERIGIFIKPHPTWRFTQGLRHREFHTSVTLHKLSHFRNRTKSFPDIPIQVLVQLPKQY